MSAIPVWLDLSVYNNRSVLFIVSFDLCVSLQAMSSPEDRAYEIMRELDVSYVLVIFGGLTGYASDGELHVYTGQYMYSSVAQLFLISIKNGSQYM